MNRQFTYAVYSDNAPGLLQRITSLFTKRKVNIESLTVSKSQTDGVARYSIVIYSDVETASKIGRQLRRIEDVHSVMLVDDSECIGREVAIVRIGLNGKTDTISIIEKILNAKAIEITGQSAVFVIAGSESEIDSAFRAAKRFPMIEFARSGIVAIGRSHYEPVVKPSNDDVGDSEAAAETKILGNAIFFN